MSVERTFSIIKPDAVAAGQAGEILAMIQKAGFRILSLRMTRLSEQGQTIGEIIAAVEDLSQQSNLLAVNAAIEDGSPALWKLAQRLIDDAVARGWLPETGR